MTTSHLCWTQLLLLLLAVLPGQGCNHSNGLANRSDIAPSPSVSAVPTTSPHSTFQGDLQFVRNGQYTFIWVFSRKDGKPIDKEDASFLRTNAPQVVDWVSTDEGKRVIGGTNFDLEQGNLEMLKKRFVVENYSGK